MKDIDTLIPDIYELFLEKEHEINEENLDRLLANIKDVCLEYLGTAQKVHREPELRISKIGTKDRKLWFEFHAQEWLKRNGGDKVVDPVKIGPRFLRFFAGNIWEALLLFLAREAGHLVEREQEEIDIDGVRGHLDSFIDSHLVDVKTASPYGYAKFKDLDTFLEDDSFGYLEQISGYFTGAGQKGEDVYFWVFNKSTCEMLLLEIPKESLTCGEERVKRVKEVIAKDKPPEEKCWPAQPHGKSGNMKLHKNCGFCEFKRLCWKDANKGKGLRTFKYSNGYIDFVEVKKKPNVEEIYSG